MKLSEIKNAIRFLSNTPFHPQWLMNGEKGKFLRDTSKSLQGTVIDIGCTNKFVKEYLNKDVQYIGLDYFTAFTLYKTKPDIYGNTENLPFTNNSFDAVFLLDVIEHVKYPDSCMQEIARILIEGGKLILNVPFMYPIHDAPHDYQRWTIYGLRNLLEKNNMIIEKEDFIGNSFETAGLLLNLAICKVGFTLFDKRHPGCVIILLFPVVIPIINLCAFISGKLFKPDDFMPYRYHLTAVKKYK